MANVVDYEWIEFSNLASFGNKVTRFDFKEGTHLITGKNGSGKSALLMDVLHFALFGSPYRDVKLQSIINRNNKTLYVAVGFTIDKRDQYVITRTLSRTKSATQKISLFKVVDGVRGENEVDKGSNSQIQSIIDRLIDIDSKMFKQIVSTSINNRTPFLAMGTAEKRTTLEVLCNLDVIIKVLKSVKDDKSKNKISFDLKETQLLSFDRVMEQIKIRYDDLEKSHEYRMDEIAVKGGEYLKLYNDALIQDQEYFVTEKKKITEMREARIKQLKELIEQAGKDAVIVAEEATKNEVNKCLYEITHIESLITLLRENAQDQINGLNSELISLNDKIANAEKLNAEEVARVKLVNDAIELEISQITASMNEIQLELNKYVEDIKATPLTDTSTVTNEISKLTQLVNSENTKMGICNSNITRLEALIAKIVSATECPTCGQDLSEEHRLKESKAYIDEVEVCKKELFECQTKIDQFGTHINTYNALVATATANNELYAKIKTEATQKMYVRDDYKSKITILEGKRQLPSEIDINSLKQSIITHEQNIKALQESLVSNPVIIEHQRNIALLKDKLPTIAVQPVVLDAHLKLELETLVDREVDVLVRDTATPYKMMIQNLNSDKESTIKQYHLMKEKIKAEEASNGILMSNTRKEYDDLKKEMEVIQISIDLLASDTGIRNSFYSMIIPMLNQNIETYITLFGLPYQIVFDSEMEYTIRPLGTREFSEYNSFSEGEKKRVDISILLSFVNMSKMISNWTCNLLIFDEVLDGAVDVEGLDIIMNSIKAITKQNEITSYIISHRAKQCDIFDSYINVAKNGDYSTITITN